MSTITQMIDEQLEITADRSAVADCVADFIRKGVESGDAEALVMFLVPAVQHWVNSRHADYTRKIRKAASERVDGFGGPTSFPTSDGVTEEIRFPGLLDAAVLADTFKINGVFIRVGEMTVAQHQSMVDRYVGMVDAIQDRVDFHTEAIRAINLSGVDCLNNL